MSLLATSKLCYRSTVRNGLYLKKSSSVTTNRLDKRLIRYVQNDSKKEIEELDPQQMAAVLIARNKSTAPRLQGSETSDHMPLKVQLSNGAMAVGLVGFVTWVWWYSIKAVGGAGNEEIKNQNSSAVSIPTGEGGFQQLQREAEVERERRSLRKAEEKRVRKEILGDEYEDDDDEEEVDNEQPKKKSGRPLWKKVVFFWKRE
mmetsp:Transcript_65141/g.76521  ORF Transcript_65141/g.76521 Transcript_65141/m.76521 type:complete len:202 (-) Transcript_65141:440-1045(-)